MRKAVIQMLFLGRFGFLISKGDVGCNNPTIDSYNNYHLIPNGIPSCNQRWYGLVYKWLVNLELSLGNC